MFEANGKRIVLFEDIDYLCSRFSSLTAIAAAEEKAQSLKHVEGYHQIYSL